MEKSNEEKDHKMEEQKTMEPDKEASHTLREEKQDQKTRDKERISHHWKESERETTWIMNIMNHKQDLATLIKITTDWDLHQKKICWSCQMNKQKLT